ncbi:unnamed protein product [Brassica oleracea]
MTLRESVEGLEIVVGDVYAMEIEASGSCALLSSSPSLVNRLLLSYDCMLLDEREKVVAVDRFSNRDRVALRIV